ncbi:MAG: hypothetical protein AB7O30_21875 [Dehalococcoidia bacterium]
MSPQFQQLADQLASINSASGGLISVELTLPEATVAPPVFEPLDMRRVDFDCHPDEPVKVLENWEDPVFCLCCGTVKP